MKTRLKEPAVSIGWRLLAVGLIAPFLLVVPTWAAPTTTNYQLTVQTSRANALYEQGEVVRFDLTLLQNGEPLPVAEIRWSTSKDGFPPERVGRLTSWPMAVVWCRATSINHGNAVVANVARDDGTSGRNRVALGMFVGRRPRVAHFPQPGALGQNRVGIPERPEREQSQRDCAHQPKDGAKCLPWVEVGNRNNANGVVAWATKREAWRRRVEVLRDAGRQLCMFNPEKSGAGPA
ncbi:MAG: hypothetical protein IH623_24530 [Verrucomicrobia bacterium]|nr:hypothetical protein [Verrucomicrobiota bacterium]